MNIFWRWSPWYRYSGWGAKRQGEWDREYKIPSNNDPDPPFYINELKNAGILDIDYLSQKWLSADKKLKRKLLKKEGDYKQNEIYHAFAKEQLEKAENGYKSKHNTNALPPIEISSSWWYKLVIFVLFISEFPMNAIVFRLFGEAEVFTYVVTFGIALALLLCAHYLGIFFKEEDWNVRRNEIIRKGLIFGLIVVPILVIGSVAWLREEYLSVVSEESELVSSSAMYFIFFVFNLGIFFVAAVVSYFSHIDDLYLKAIYQAEKEFKKAEEKLGEASRKVIEVENKRNNKWNEYNKECNQKITIVGTLGNIYISVNSNCPKEPNWFKDYSESIKIENLD